MALAHTYRGAIGVLAATAALALPTTGEAAQVEVVPYNDGQGHTYLKYTAGPGEDNDLEVVPAVDGVVFREQSVGIDAGPSCAQLTPTSVGCSSEHVQGITIYAGDGSNEVEVEVDLTASIYGAAATKNVFVAGDGRASLVGGEGDDELYGGAGINDIRGYGGDDLISGGPGEDDMEGGQGDDTFTADAGADRMNGDGGHDTVDYSARTKPVAVFFDGSYNSGAIAGPYSLAEHDVVGESVEAAIGGTANDTLVGSSDPNRLTGGPGDDSLDTRGGGVDVADCGDGTDTALTDADDTRTACELPAPAVAQPPMQPPPAPSSSPLQPAVRPAAPKSAGPKVRIGPARLRIGILGRVPVRIRCPRTAVRHCTGVLSLGAGTRARP
ncbi:MAG TPA: hypothetical protein VFY44_10750, partial [Thermoleophilaceae bacterium]|nr:hypothetical protein [Thermoleophilaceae bacterium]